VVFSLVLAVALHLPGVSHAEQAAIARTYAPVFVFHPDERYFPTSPLFPLDLDDVPRRAVTTARALEEGLGTVSDRIARYERLTRIEKLGLATIHWRVYRTHDIDGEGIVAEYWCYYPFNAFEFHGGLVPYAVRDDHRHDLERVFIILRRRAGSASLKPGEDERAWAQRAFSITRIVASAHDGAIPANRFDVEDGHAPPLPIEILVEHGSHAMAADVNRDGMFEADVDSTTPQHGGFVWGIRDHGETSSVYRSSYMDRRDPETAVRLCPESAAAAAADSDAGAGAGAAATDSCATYALASADDLQQWFEGLKLTQMDRGRIVGHTSTIVGLFGDASIEDLMVPADRPDGRMLRRMLERGCDSERGIFAGVITALRNPAAMIGGRFAMPTNVPLVSELMAEASAIAPRGQRLRGEVSLLGFHRTDAVLKVLGGIGWFSRDRGNRLDAIAGFEMRLGRLRVRPTMRVKARDLDSRIVLLF
jgi:hypothetical protein